MMTSSPASRSQLYYQPKKHPLLSVLLFFVMLGLFRSIGHIPIFIGYVAGAAGLVWLGLNRRITKQFLPTYLLVIWGALSAVNSGLGFTNYLQLLLVVGGVGIAEIIARTEPEELARGISRYWVWPILIVTGIEFIFFALDMGQRTRVINESVTAGLLNETTWSLPRLMGSMGGSAYSATMLGALACFCWVEQRKRTAAILAIVSLFMVSRGPLIALLVALMFQAFREQKISRWGATALLGVCIGFPLIIWQLEQSLSWEQQIFLIQISSSRFLHYLSFLDFGLENPIFGIGYSNWRGVYEEYFWGDGFQYLLESNNVGLIREAHNLMLDVFGELGVVGWLLAAWQVATMGFIAIRGDARHGAMFVYTTTCFLFLSGFSSWSFWFTNGVLLGHHQRQRARAQESKSTRQGMR